MIVFILEYLFIFLTGATLGWCLELIYRRYFGLARKWINPGFLSGPYLPLYGTGMCLLYIVCNIQMPLSLRMAIFATITTGIEYMTGAFFFKKYNVRLWDYSHMKFNLHGHITPLYTCFWTLLSIVFYYVLYPYFYKQIEFIYTHLEVSLLIGIFYGFVFVDVMNSFDVLNRLLKIKDNLGVKTTVIHFEFLKEEMKLRIDGFHYKIDNIGSDISDTVEDLNNNFHDKVEDLGNEFHDRVENIGHKITYSVGKIKEKPSFFFPFKNKIQLRMFIENILKK